MSEIKIKGLSIGNLEFPLPFFAAPLAGISDKAYRRVLKEQGCPMVFTEMVSAKALLYENRKTGKIIDLRGEKGPLGVQIFGRDIKALEEGAKKIEAIGADVLDFNMGCPAPKIVKNGEGSALLKEPDLALKILEHLVKSVSIPVTLKIRKSFNQITGEADVIIRELGNIGVKAVFVHGRTREEYYSGSADWESIKRLKQMCTIPLIGNGDILTPEDGVRMLETTGCDGILIGRGFLGNPFLSRQITEYFTSGSYGSISIEERLSGALRQLDYAIEDKGEELAVREMRKQIAWYFKGLHSGSFYREKTNRCSTKEDVRGLIEHYLENGKVK